jgi:glutathione S-transferase
MVIVPLIDAEFAGPRLTPTSPAERHAMGAMMQAVMALHYGVLLYSRRLDADGKSPTVIERGNFLRREREKHPERAEALDRRIAGNERLQKLLADPAEVEKHIGEAKAVVAKIDAALEGRDFVSARTWTLADTYATAALARFRLHGFQDWWEGGEYSRVAAYYERMQARPSFARAGVVDSGTERDL